MNKLLLGKSGKIGARNKVNTIPIEIYNTYKPTIIKDVKTSVDLYRVYEEEYANCKKFRITLTIKPYCTNILFNTCTEIVKDEGSDWCYMVSDNLPAPNLSEGEVFGRVSNLYRNYMVSNTEYSSPEIGYTYLPGYDIFDNHTLRSLTFRPIMKVNASQLQGQTRNCFNTVRDYMRTENGMQIEFYPRFSIESIENATKLKMHVYDHSNLLPFIEGTAFDANITVENGWYGFKNTNSISCEPQSGFSQNALFLGYQSHQFSRTINNTLNCDFVDMFPDRSRYSFVPQYNKFRNRYEKNWDVFLTYPWKCYYNHNLVRNVKSFNGLVHIPGDGETYAMATMRCYRTRVSTNRNTFIFRTFCKHGVLVGDKVAVYLSKDNGCSYSRLQRVYKVDYVGDENGENEEYFFGISTKQLLNDIFEGVIESIFYTTNTGGEQAQYTVSNKMTEVPIELSDKVISVYSYVMDTNPNMFYDDEHTLDELPKTVNVFSNLDIRVWNKEYTYMVWDYSSGTYANPSHEPNSNVEYGTWNTFNDIPLVFSKEYIRVKNYNYYNRVSKNYKLKEALLNGDVTINDLINNVFMMDAMLNNPWHIRYVKVDNDLDCKYYIRQLKKIPNLKNSEEPLPSGITLNSDTYDNFIKQNATEEGKMLEFDSETYKLGFSKTLYGDDVAQITFLDNVEINNLTDNLGRPVTDIYCTIVKRNSGYKQWYTHVDSSTTSEQVEISRCFGSVITGFEYLDLDEIYDRDDSTRSLKGMMSSITSLYRDDRESGNTPMSVEDWDNDRADNEILVTDDEFFADVVEYNPSKCKETVLSDACFRFNTAQREVGDDTDNGDFDFTHTELAYDDFDPTDAERVTPFKAITYKQWLQSDGEESLDVKNNIGVRRKEGYFYKPHTKIPLFKFTDNILQGSHRTLQIKSCNPIQYDSILIKVTTTTMHGVGEMNTVYICEGKNWYQTSVAYVIDNYTFAMKPMSKNDADRNGIPYLDWVTICNKIMSGDVKIRIKNEKIPSYANMVSENLFLWRDVVNPVSLPDTDKYRHPFSNDAFYVDGAVNVYLRRQDPFGINGLFKGDIGEIEGKPRRETNNKYKQAKEIKCY